MEHGNQCLFATKLVLVYKRGNVDLAVSFKAEGCRDCFGACQCLGISLEGELKIKQFSCSLLKEVLMGEKEMGGGGVEGN